jgi:hypothetical protein
VSWATAPQASIERHTKRDELSVAVQTSGEVARTFAEIESALGR